MAVAVLVERVRQHDRITWPMGEDAQRRDVRREMHVEVARAHVDDRRVDDLTLHIEHVDRVGDVHAALGDAVDEALRRHPLATQVAVGVDSPHLDGVNAVLRDRVGG